MINFILPTYVDVYFVNDVQDNMGIGISFSSLFFLESVLLYNCFDVQEMEEALQAWDGVGGIELGNSLPERLE